MTPPLSEATRLLDETTEVAARAGAAWQSIFAPRRWLRNPHLQTLAGNFLPRKPLLPVPENELVEVVPAIGAVTASRVLCQAHWQPEGQSTGLPTLLLVHGLEGSSQSQYVRGNAARFYAAGWNVVRMNMRNCGGTERETPTLYHSGLSGDVETVVRHYRKTRGAEQWALVGYSMGGNLVLKLAGELGQQAAPLIIAAAGVSPVMDLAPSSDALHELANRAYEWKFLRGLVRRYVRKCELFPEIYDPSRVRGVRSLREFDDRVMSPYCGFAGADDYYERAASARVAGSIAVPTLVLHALDDPFIRMLPATRATLLENENTHLVETEHGGHCAFLAPPTGYDGYWAERLLFDFLQAQAEA
jgi:uncharacterized protein